MLELKFTDAGLRAGAQHGHLSPEAAGIRFGETGICDGLRGCGDMRGPRTLPGHLAAPLGMATVC